VAHDMQGAQPQAGAAGVEAAVAALREEGLVYTVQARGTYVARLDGATR